MATDWYIEANPKARWRQVSREFSTWALAKIGPERLEGFGYHEWNSVESEGKIFLCLSFSSRSSVLAEVLVPQWAVETGRAYGKAIERTLQLSTGHVVTLPEVKEVTPPPWLSK